MFHAAVPEVVQSVFDELAERVGRHYSVVDYWGAPDADRVLVVMGSAAGAVAETVDALVERGDKVGLFDGPAVPAVPGRHAGPSAATLVPIDRRAGSHEGARRGG